ncbi:MAG: tRNA glutamyl-Q(34) synthetase GluQRS [Pseudomonadota bacterium]
MVTRFAPSPTGLLHLGHAFSAFTAWDRVKEAKGVCLLRIEDIDRSRARGEYETAIFDDLAWLGLTWPKPVMRQSDRSEAYAAAIGVLGRLGVLYPCRCTRADIRQALAAPQEGAEMSSTSHVYPGTCLGRTLDEARPTDALRLNLDRAFEIVGNQTLTWLDTGPISPGEHILYPTALKRDIGDVVLGRKDIGTAAYHLAVVVDDAAQGVTHVVRGADLIEATPIHRLLQELLGLPVPVWHHHELVRDEAGKRLAKRDDARAIRTYRESGISPDDLRGLSRSLAR